MEIASHVQVIEAMQSINAVDVEEVCFPLRFTEEAVGLGLPPRIAVDLEMDWKLADTNQFIEAKAVTAKGANQAPV